MTSSLALQSIVFIFPLRPQMITTHDEDKARFIPLDQSISTWRTAALNLGVLYTFINYGLKEGNNWIYQTSILWDSRDVLNFVRSIDQNKRAKIVDIALLEPSRRSSVQTWRWVKVLRIHLYVHDEIEHPVYSTDAGEMVGLTPEEANQALKVIYSYGHD